MPEDEIEGSLPEEKIEPENEIYTDDLYSMYMKNKSKIGKCYDSNELFMRTIFSISVGMEMLDEDESNDDIRTEAETILDNASKYPGKRKMSIDTDGRYELGTSDDKTGYIYVRPSEIQIGIREVINQQVSQSITEFSKVERKIFRKLINEGLIITKRPTLDDMFEMYLQGMFDKFESIKENLPVIEPVKENEIVE